MHRRRFHTAIAKVNARSVDGYFGEGTPCFFIRGTILSDAQVDGEYRTLSIQRPGNVIEIEAFDGEWATLVIVTRAGNRVGDNITARMVMRDADLRAVGIDCERIMAGLGTFQQPDEPEVPFEPPVVAVPFAPIPPPPPPSMAMNGMRKPTLDHDHDHVAAVVHPPEPPAPPPPEPVHEPTPLPEATFVPAPEVLIVPASEKSAPDTHAVIERISAQAKPATTGGTLFGGRTAIADGRVLVEVGTGAIVAIGLPVVLFFLRGLFNDKKKK